MSEEATRSVQRTAAAERLYREQGDRLWRAALAFAGDPEVAADAVAEAFAQLLRRGDAVRSPEAWVWRAAFRIAAGELKERSRGLTGSVGAMEAAAPTKLSDVADTVDVIAALARVSPKQRASIVLHHYAGFPVREVAAMLDSTGPAVRVHLSRGRRRLRELLEVRDD